jgi:hypothetical protein
MRLLVIVKYLKFDYLIGYFDMRRAKKAKNSQILRLSSDFKSHQQVENGFNTSPRPLFAFGQVKCIGIAMKFFTNTRILGEI